MIEKCFNIKEFPHASMPLENYAKEGKLHEENINEGGLWKSSIPM